jgi:hypothetical protein
MNLPINGLLHKRLFDDDTIDDDSVSISSENNVPIFRYDIGLLLPLPSLWNDDFSPVILVFGFVTG